jgi:hypothetical protein
MSKINTKSCGLRGIIPNDCALYRTTKQGTWVGYYDEETDTIWCEGVEFTSLSWFASYVTSEHWDARNEGRHVVPVNGFITVYTRVWAEWAEMWVRGPTVDKWRKNGAITRDIQLQTSKGETQEINW